MNTPTENTQKSSGQGVTSSQEFRDYTITVADGERIHLCEIGQGAPLFFLHGWSGSHDRNRPLMADLAADYRAIAWDARGHGRRTYHTTTPATLDQLVEDLHEVLNALELDRVTLIGHSMGAALTWAYMRKYGTGRVSNTVIVDMTPKLGTDDNWRYGVYFDFPPQRQTAFIEELEQDLPEAILRLCAYGHHQPTRKLYEANDPVIQMQRKWLHTLPPRSLIELWQSLTEQDFREFLTSLQVPTLLIYGGQSHFYGKELAEWMHATLPRSTLLFMPDGDHSPHLMFPVEAARAIRDLLASGSGNDGRKGSA